MKSKLSAALAAFSIVAAYAALAAIDGVSDHYHLFRLGWRKRRPGRDLHRRWVHRNHHCWSVLPGAGLRQPIRSLFAGPIGGGPTTDALSVTWRVVQFRFVRLGRTMETWRSFLRFLGGVQQYQSERRGAGSFRAFGFDTITINGAIAVDSLTIALASGAPQATVDNINVSVRPRPHRGRWTARPDLGERWPSRLVATAAEDRLSIKAICTRRLLASDCRINRNSWAAHALMARSLVVGNKSGNRLQRTWRWLRTTG